MYLSVVLLVCLPLLCVLQYGRMAVPNTGGKAKNQSINQLINYNYLNPEEFIYYMYLNAMHEKIIPIISYC